MRAMVWGLGLLIGCSETGLSGRYEVGTDAPPDIVVEPLAVDFGALPEGSLVTRTVRIANRGGSSLAVDRLLLGPNAAFSIPDPGVSHAIEPNEAVLQEVRYTAANAHDTSWLRIVSDDPDEPQVDVGLTGAALVPELTIEPDPLSLGEVPCSEIGQVALRNTGGAPLTIEGVLVNGAAYALAVEPAVPHLVLPGEALPVDVIFEPGPGDVEHLGSIVVDSDDPRGVRTGAVDGLGVAPPSHLDRFEQVENDWTRLDLMFFVDQSGSMGNDAANLGTNFGRFADILLANGLDYQVMVVNNDDGCTNSGILTPSSPDPEGTFLAAVQAGGGTYTEAGMIVASRALEATDPSECNAGFLRDGVTPIAVLVSDEPEQSPGGWGSYLPGMLARAPDLVISAVVGQPTSGCGALDGAGYHEPAAATGGADLDICGADWGSYFYDIIGVIDPPLSTFALSATPDPATLAVSIDGGPASGWSYSAPDNAVVFADISLPPPGSEIEVAYDEAPACP